MLKNEIRILRNDIKILKKKIDQNIKIIELIDFSREK